MSLEWHLARDAVQAPQEQPVVPEGGQRDANTEGRDMFLVDLVEADEVEMVREGCRAAEVWRVSELRSLDGTRPREAVEPNGALAGLVGKGKAGKAWQCSKGHTGVG